MKRKLKKQFRKAATDQASRYNLDPLDIKKKYKGREELLVKRAEHSQGAEIGQGFSWLGAGATTVATGIGTLMEYDLSSKYDPFDIGDNLAIAAPFMVASLAGVYFTRKSKKDTKKVMEREMEEFGKALPGDDKEAPKQLEHKPETPPRLT